MFFVGNDYVNFGWSGEISNLKKRPQHFKNVVTNTFDYFDADLSKRKKESVAN